MIRAMIVSAYGIQPYTVEIEPGIKTIYQRLQAKHVYEVAPPMRFDVIGYAPGGRAMRFRRRNETAMRILYGLDGGNAIHGNVVFVGAALRAKPPQLEEVDLPADFISWALEMAHGS